MKLHYFGGSFCPAMWASLGVHIVHTVSNNTLCAIGLITRWSLFLGLWPRSALPA
jgi:hypothetical protein